MSFADTQLYLSFPSSGGKAVEVLNHCGDSDDGKQDETKSRQDRGCCWSESFALVAEHEPQLERVAFSLKE